MKLSDYKTTDKKDVKKPDAKTERILRSLVKDYEGRSEDELIASIVAVAAKKREEGTLSDRELDAFYQMLLPSVTPDQKKKLDEVMAMLKSVK